MKFSKSFLSNLYLFAAAFNATINPDEHNMRMVLECFNAQLDEAETNLISEVETVTIETHMQLA